MNTSRIVLRGLTIFNWSAIFSGIALFDFTLSLARAEVVLPSYLSSNMVLQRGVKNRIWGKGEAGAKIQVKFLLENESITVDKNNSWKIDLDLRDAKPKGQSVLTIKETIKGKKGEPDKVATTELTDILVGDVWIINDTPGEGVTIPSAPLTKLGAPVRILQLSNLTNLNTFNESGETINLKWQMPDTHEISALALCFAEQLNAKQTKVPIGIILADLAHRLATDMLKVDDPGDPKSKWLNEIKERALYYATTNFNAQKKSEYTNLVNLKRQGLVSTNSQLKNYPDQTYIHMRSEFDSKQLPASLLSFEGALW